MNPSYPFVHSYILPLVLFSSEPTWIKFKMGCFFWSRSNNRKRGEDLESTEKWLFCGSFLGCWPLASFSRVCEDLTLIFVITYCSVCCCQVTVNVSKNFVVEAALVAVYFCMRQQITYLLSSSSSPSAHSLIHSVFEVFYLFPLFSRGCKCWKMHFFDFPVTFWTFLFSDHFDWFFSCLQKCEIDHILYISMHYHNHLPLFNIHINRGVLGSHYHRLS